MPDDSPLSPIDLLTLAALGERPRYGYDLSQRIEQLTRGRVRIRPGNLYRVLQRLEDRGWIREDPDAADADEDDRRRYFVTTPEGRRVAADELRMYEGILGSTEALRSGWADA